MARSEHDPVGHHRRAFLDTAELTSQRAEPGRHVLGPEPAELVSLDRDHTSLLVPDGDQRPLRRTSGGTGSAAPTTSASTRQSRWCSSPPGPWSGPGLPWSSDTLLVSCQPVFLESRSFRERYV